MPTPLKGNLLIWSCSGPFRHFDLPPRNESKRYDSIGLPKGGFFMGKKRVTPEQIIMKLREIEVLTGQGENVLTE